MCLTLARPYCLDYSCSLKDVNNLARRLAEADVPESERLRGEAILRLTEAACAQAAPDSADTLTGVVEVDDILRAHHVVAVEPVFRTAGRRSAQSLRRLFRILLEEDRDLRGLISDLRNHPDVEAVTLRNILRTFS